MPSRTDPDDVPFLVTLCLYVLDLRLIACAATCVEFAVRGSLPPYATVALPAGILLSYLPLRRWEQLAPFIIRHPALLALDVLIASLMLLAAGTDGPFYFYLVGSALLGGLIYGWRGAALFGTICLIAHVLVEVHDSNGRLPAVNVLLGAPLLYPFAAAAGAAVAGLLVQLAAQSEATSQAAQDAASAEERARLARELHDTLAKTVQGVSLLAAALPGWIERDPKRAASSATEISISARRAVKESREILATMRAAATLPLAEQLAQAAGARAGAAKVALRSGCDLQVSLSSTSTYEMRRVVEEAVDNAVRHGAADEVKISVSTSNGWARVEIADNGSGFEVADARTLAATGHFGLLGMQERLARVGANVKITSRPGRGSNVVAHLPLLLDPTIPGAQDQVAVQS